VDVETLTPALRQAYSFVPQSGAVVADVVSGSPADSAGIQQGDVIVAFGGNAITNADDLVTAVRSRSPGASVKVAFWRGQVKMTVTATLASTPAS
jgi:S1-C subfamily serine protease